MTAYSDFISDSNRQGVHLYEISYLNIATGAAGTLYYSTSAWGTTPADSLVSKRYDARILEGYRHMSGSGAAGEGGVAPRAGLLPAREGGSFSVAQKFGDLDGLRAYNFDKQSVVIRYGGESKYGVLAYDDFKVVFSGTCDGQPLIGMDQVTFKLATRDALLYSPIQTKRYRGGNWCLLGDGTGQYVDLSYNAAYNFGANDPFSFELWYYPRTSGATQCFLSRGQMSAGYYIEQTSSDEISFGDFGIGGATILSAPIDMERWYHIAVTHDGVSEAHLYIDGLDAEVSHTGTFDVTAGGGTEELVLFRRRSGTYPTNCMLDEIRCWKRVLTQDEIQSRMNRPLTAAEITDADLVGYWPCEDGTGSVLTDLSATAEHGIISASDVDWVPSLQGGDATPGSLVPHTVGEKFGMQPVLVHAQTNIYQVHSAQIEEIVAVYEGLSPRSIDGAVITDLVTFLLDTTEVGMYQVLNCAQGSYFRLRNRPTLPLSVTLKGDKSDGTYRDNPFDVSRYIACNRGQYPLTDADDIDDAAFDAAATATSGMIVGHTSYDEETVGDVIALLLGSVGAVAWFKRDGGRLTALRYIGAAAGTPVIALDQTDIKEGTLEPLDAGPPICRVSIAWGPNDVVHDTADIAGAIQGTEGQNFGMLDWRIASVFNRQTLVDYPSAMEFSMESALSYSADAWAEAARLQLLYGTMPQAFKAMFKHRSVELERFDCISFQFQDYDRRGELQSRFGTSAPGGTPTQYTVFALEENEVEGGTVVTFAREDITVDAD